MPVGDEVMEIVICMGSSCFARGNAENLRALKDYIDRHKLSAAVHAKGQLCRDKCTVGPSITIDGIEYHSVETGSAVRLLERALTTREPE